MAGWGVCCAAPCSDWVRHPRVVLLLFTLSAPFVSFPFLFCLVFGVGGEVRWCVRRCCRVAAAVFGVVCVSVCCVVLLCCGMAGGVVSSLVFLSSPLSLSLCVGVRGSARAALRARTSSPNTNVFSLLCFPLSLCPAFLLLEWRCVIHHVSVCCVGMTAMGSLSRSFSFFW